MLPSYPLSFAFGLTNLIRPSMCSDFFSKISSKFVGRNDGYALISISKIFYQNLSLCDTEEPLQLMHKGASCRRNKCICVSNECSSRSLQMLNMVTTSKLRKIRKHYADKELKLPEVLKF